MLNVTPRRELTGLPVYRADLNPPVMNAEHGKAASLDYAGRSQPNRKAGPAGAALGWPKKPRPVCNEPDMPTSVWPGKARKSMWNHFYLGIAIDERRPSLGAPRAAAHRSSGMEGRSPVLPNGPRELRCAP